MKNKPTPDTLLVAIRAKCMDCCGNCRKEVERCKQKHCPLYPFRSVRAIGNEREHRTEIKGQIDFFGALSAGMEGNLRD